MLRRRTVIILIIVAAVWAFTAGVFSLNRSLWFIWHSLPAGDVRLALDLQQPAGAALAGFLQPRLNPTVSRLLERSEKIAFSRAAGHVAVMVLPRPAWSLRAQRAFISEFETTGWQVHRRGAALLAVSPQPEPPPPSASLGSAMRPAMRHYIAPAASRQPFFISSLTENALPFLSLPFSALGVQRNGVVLISAAHRPSLPDLPHTNEISWPHSHNQGSAVDLAVALPREIITRLPKDLHREWQSLLRRQLKFTHTDPDLLAAASVGQRVVKLAAAGEHAALAVEGNAAQFVGAVEAALQAEEAYLRPERRSFRLPDKTVGFELVPGAKRDLLDSEAAGCLPALKLWLCREWDRAALASDQALALEAVRATPWHIHAAAKYTRLLPWPLAELSAQGSPAGDILIRAKLAAD